MEYVEMLQAEAEIRKEEQARLLRYLKGLSKINPSASLEATIDLIETTNPRKNDNSNR